MNADHRAAPLGLSRQQVAEAWPMIRPSQVGVVAQANQVEVVLYQSGPGGTWGSWSTHYYDPAAVRRVAEALVSDSATVEPIWRLDTREGRDADRADRRRRLLTVLSAVLVVAIIVVAGVLTSS
jgi:hypothetical protein